MGSLEGTVGSMYRWGLGEGRGSERDGEVVGGFRVGIGRGKVGANHGQGR